MKHTAKVKPTRWSHVALSAASHALAVATIFTLFVSLFLTEQSLALLKIGLFDELLQADVATPLVLLFGLAACAWSLLFIVYKLVRTHVDRPVHVNLKKARGTVVTETLIVLPVFFLLTFGLAQMALNSIAGLLSTLASYEVTRTLGVWAVEEGNNRAPGGTVTASHIRDRARLAAAMVIAPATPNHESGVHCDRGSALPLMLEGLGGAGLDTTVDANNSISTMAEAFGHATFASRGPAKLTGAYCNINVTWSGVNTDSDYTGRSMLTTNLQYHHPAVMPLVGPIFSSDPGAGTWSTNHVSTFERSYSVRTYLTPNVHLPFSAWYAP